MINTILRLLAASASFLALLLFTNSTTLVAPLEPTQVQPPSISLNLISPSLQLAGDRAYSLTEHLGCSCAVCTQSSQRTSDRLIVFS